MTHGTKETDDTRTRQRTGHGPTGATRRALLRAGGAVAVAGAGARTGFAGGIAPAAAQESDSAGLRQTDRLTHPDEEAGEFDLFGLAIDSDDDEILVGAPLWDGAVEDAGAAYLFRDDEDEWTLQHRFDASDDARQGARFGGAVALDGDTVIIGAEGDTEVGPEAGAAYVFERDGDGWSRAQKLLPPEYDDEWPFGPTFGWRVDLAGDRAVVSAPENSTFDVANGAAYVYERDDTGHWQTVDALYPGESGIAHPFYLVEFGRSIVLADGRILVGAPGDSEAGPDAGAAYVFELGDDGWERQRKLLAEEPDPNARFGHSVALDGDTALIGAPFNEEAPGTTEYGAAYLHTRGDGDWRLETQFSLSEPAATPGGWFGYAVTLQDDRALVTRPNATGEEAVDSGAAYAFDRAGESWSRSQRLVADDPENGELFGIAADSHGTRTVVTDSLYDGSAPQSGTAYVFEPAEATGATGPGLGVSGLLTAVVFLVLRALTGRRSAAA